MRVICCGGGIEPSKPRFFSRLQMTISMLITAYQFQVIIGERAAGNPSNEPRMPSYLASTAITWCGCFHAVGDVAFRENFVDEVDEIMYCSSLTYCARGRNIERLIL